MNINRKFPSPLTTTLQLTEPVPINRRLGPVLELSFYGRKIPLKFETRFLTSSIFFTIKNRMDYSESQKGL